MVKDFKGFFGLVAAGFLASAPVAGTAQNIGVVASITPQMSGQPPGQGVRTLGQGVGVVSEERIVTGANGRGQLLFLDETTLTVASSSQVVLDRFIYDPDRGAGEIGLSITRGALRFIGGATSDRQEATIVTPTGTIGIRGSSVLVLVQDDGSTIVVFVAGDRLCFTTNTGNRDCTNRRGGMISSDDGYLGRVAPEFLAQLLARIDGPQPTGGGGSFGSGIPGDNPGHRGSVSTSGETYDEAGFDSPFGTDAIEGLIPDGGNTVDPGTDAEPPNCDFNPTLDLDDLTLFCPGT